MEASGSKRAKARFIDGRGKALNHEEMARLLAFVLVRFTAQARGRLMQLLPSALRDEVAEMQEVAADLQERMLAKA